MAVVVEATVGGRFAAERKRLGLGVQEAATRCRVTRNAISKIEREGGAMPSGAVLQAFAEAGADVHYVLTGERRVGLIDGTTYGMCEVAVVSAYAALRPGVAVPTAVRSGPVVQVYNRVMLSPRASTDLPGAVREMAELMIASLNDPLDPAHLERNLFRQPVDPQASGVNVSGNHNRVAGRDYVRIGGGNEGSGQD
ncbi:MAG: helix-turn-helix transcriptional regulator [Pseudoxanthomonas sp.]|uniref:helix-turn-helix domain-containing protein n=1 Tax=Pseudoxanthomonas sp. TaxID=1871049 RepID=UPI00258C57DC|nr:helix-turn-helix transcriptional regulator [Pseudoxanthomonas sp.]MCH2092707.1 helix-turn-helix transcriptional regulator [Pseudoxanthomonas sp.]